MDDDIIPIDQLPQDDVIPINQLPTGETKRTNVPDYGGALKTMGLAGGIVGGIAGLEKLGGAVGRYFYQPEVRKQRTGLQEQLGGIQKEIPSALPGQTSIEGIAPADIPKVISQRTQDMQRQKNIDIGNLESATKQTSLNLKNQLNVLDDTLVSLNAEDLAKTIKTGYPDFLRSASDAYGAGIDASDMYFQQYGRVFDNQKFSSDILDRTIEKARRAGIPDDQMSSLLNVKNIVSQVDKEGNYVFRPMQFSEAKGYISSLVNENPYGAVSGMLRENWGDFLEKNAPDEVKGMLQKLNSDFKPFAQARERMYKLVNPRTGEFDQKGLIRYLIEHTKRRYDEGTVSLMKLLGEGNDLVNPIGGVKEKFGALSQLREKRAGVKSDIAETQMSKADRLSQISKKADEEIGKMNALKSKSVELISRLGETEAKLASRNPIAALSKIWNVGKKTIGAFGIAPMFLDALTFTKDPSLYKAVQETGLGEEQLKEIRSAYGRLKEGTQSKEDESLLAGAGLIS